MATAFAGAWKLATGDLQRRDHPAPDLPRTIQTIAVPLDGSQLARAALAPAQALAFLLDAELVLMRRVVSATVPGVSEELALQLGETDAQVALGDEVERLRRLELRARGMVLSGPAEQPPATALLAAAGSVGAQLIVMATHGRTGLSRAMLGSVAEAVVREATVPVLLVSPHGGAAQPKPGAGARWDQQVVDARRRPAGLDRLRLMVALDGTPESEAALPAAADLALALGAQLSLVRVVAGNTSILGGEARTLLASEEAAAYLQAAALRLQERGLAPDVLHVSVRVGGGGASGVAERLLEQAEREHAAILVVATRARTGLAGLVMPSATREIVSRAPIPVLVVHAQDPQ
jgi:nucleotide-binding universal stress UspA family protein